MSLLKSLTLFIMLSLLSGCELLPAQSSAALDQPLPITELRDLNDWLSISTAVSKLSADMAATKLRQLGKPEAGDELFYYGVLNQQLNHREGWIQARDAFRKLSTETAIEPNFKELARIMEAHNQALINWHARHTHLQKELAESVLDRELLERKIEALTQLEATISNRKQQSTAAPEPPPTNQ